MDESKSSYHVMEIYAASALEWPEGDDAQTHAPVFGDMRGGKPFFYGKKPGVDVYMTLKSDEIMGINGRTALIPEMEMWDFDFQMVARTHADTHPIGPKELQERLRTLGTKYDGRLSAARRLPLLRQHLRLAVLRDCTESGEALRSKVMSLDMRIFRL